MAATDDVAATDATLRYTKVGAGYHGGPNRAARPTLTAYLLLLRLGGRSTRRNHERIASDARKESAP